MLDPRSPEQAGPTRSAPRRRLPQRVYWRRRIGVVLVLGLVGWAGVTAATGLLGSDDGATSADTGVSADAGDADTADGADDLDVDGRSASGAGAEGAAGADATIDGGVGADGSAAGTGTDAQGFDGTADETGSDAGAETGVRNAGTDESDADTDDGPPTADNPATVHIVGDSDAGTFGPYLQTLLDNTLIVDTSLDYKVSSGLARPDFFNWPEQLRTTVPEVDPDIVVVTFGGNDSQGLSLPQEELEFIVGDPLANEAEWSAEYERRVLEVVDILLDDGREVVWVGSPNDDSADVTAKLRIQDQAVRAALAQRPDVVFVDTWTRFSGRDGNWAEFVVDPRDGIGKDVRADDGYHL
ncbi:MAG: GDSL-type esterase/lipase family protein, partial [Actinomycetota bacterium]